MKPNFVSLSSRLKAAAHAIGLTVIPWAVNTSEQIDSYAVWGVDSIISDYPDRVLKVLQALQVLRVRQPRGRALAR